jgi:Peptidyl-prolyl cis-trans isomerase (rotamase) - cyclophilin family
MKRLLLASVAALLLISLGCAKKTEQQEETQLKKNPIATITMQDGGTMTFELYPDIAPITVASFTTLANSGFYDGLTFHRIYAGFMIQGGDPDGNGTGGPGYSIRGEFSANGVKNDLSHKRGVISMARSQKMDSAGSQFFIMHADSGFLDGQYAAFGMMTDGFVELDKLAMTPTTYNAWGEKSVPTKDVVISTIRVETFGVDYSEFEKLPD